MSDRVHITFITAYCPNHFILLVVIVNRLLCLICKLDFITGVHV